ncbi:Uncharacterized protein BM_BM17652 [Brugia malayi]|uniref:Uncharacterized protein n=1 Tax=Brugia malayi TaxID=6279 RepID=A0A4E9FMP7_BRUMA|nr:Uncharacterized protein BM_BM17652 [Brugia malayi]VIO96818.1 Uncharacterized protein BM_BM17652 [Brugia malayi]
MNRRLSSNYCTTVCQKSGVEVLRDFSWSAKLVEHTNLLWKN